MDLKAGDEVTSTYKGCEGHTFVVARIHEYNTCSSGFSVVAHLKGAPDREIKGLIIDKVNYGIDSGWFSKIF